MNNSGSRLSVSNTANAADSYSHGASDVSVSDAPDGAYQGIEDDTANAKMRKPASRTREERRSAHAELKHAQESRVSRESTGGWAHKGDLQSFKASCAVFPVRL